MLLDPLAQTIAAYDQFSDRYSERWLDSGAVSDFVDRFLGRLNGNAVVLDAGCGSGREIRALINRDIDCVGIDLSYATILRARENIPGGFFRVMDVRDIEYPDNLFDGIICVAVLHHLFDRDFRKALSQFRRVAKPGGIVALTMRLGDGYTTDEIGRVSVSRTTASIEEAVLFSGFSILDRQLSDGGEGRQWLQLVLENTDKDNFKSGTLCTFCKGDMFFWGNRSAKAPIAASILWGDDQFFVTLDVAPLTEGHLLLVTNKHVLSTLGSGQDLARISTHKIQIDHVIKKAYNRKTVFLEHGSVENNTDPCIEHAHLHALPLKHDMLSEFQINIGKLERFSNIFRADSAAVSTEYFSYENKRGQIFLNSKNVSTQPSQFMRKFVSQKLEKAEYLWLSCRDSLESRFLYDSTLRKVLDVLDAEISHREIVSDIPQEIRAKLVKLEANPESSKFFSKIGQDVISKLESERNIESSKDLLLDHIGEHDIVKKILVPYFDSGYRGASYIGDDAAVFPWRSNQLLATSDHCPKPIFFSLGIESYEAYGWLSVIISLSDIAAMGGQPKALLLNTEMPTEMKVLDYLSFIEGVSYAANTYGVRVIGGNIREAANFAASTTVLGEIGRGGDLRRDGAEPGEAIFVVGEMGLFWAAVLQSHHNLLLPLDNHNELKVGLLYPEPKVATAQILSATGIVGACMDASDGPTQAIHNLARESGRDFYVEIDKLQPNQSVALVARFLKLDPIALMFTWGNFELIFTAREADLLKSIGSDLKAHKIQKIGYVRSGKGEAFAISSGEKVKLPRLSDEQFSGVRKPSIDQYEMTVRASRFRASDFT